MNKPSELCSPSYYFLLCVLMQYRWDRIARAANLGISKGKEAGFFVWMDWISWASIRYQEGSSCLAPMHGAVEYGTLANCSVASDFLGTTPTTSNEQENFNESSLDCAQQIPKKFDCDFSAVGSSFTLCLSAINMNSQIFLI